MNPATGPQSTSFKVAAGGFTAGIGTLLSGLLNDPTKLTALQAQVNETRTWVGGVMATLAVCLKLIHDHGFNAATAKQVGAEVALKLPQVDAAADRTVDFATNELPGLRGFVTDVGSRMSSVESTVSNLISKIPDAAALEAAAKKSLSDLVQASRSTAPVAAPVPVADPPVTSVTAPIAPSDAPAGIAPEIRTLP